MSFLFKLLFCWMVPLIAMFAQGMDGIPGKTSYWYCLTQAWEQWWEK